MKYLLAVLLLLVSSPSWGATWHVRANAPPGGNGNSWANAHDSFWLTNRGLAKPGDKVYVWTGSYGGFADNYPHPDSGGSNPNGYIRYIGASLKGDPITDTTIRKTIHITVDVNINKTHVSLNGLTFNDVNFTNTNCASPALCGRDSMVNCHLTTQGSLSFVSSYYTTVHNCMIRSTSIGFNWDPGSWTYCPKILNSDIPNLNSGMGFGIVANYVTDSITIDRCKIRITNYGNFGGPGFPFYPQKPMAFFNANRLSINYSTIEIDNKQNTSCDPPGGLIDPPDCNEFNWIMWRDSCMFRQLNACTLIVKSASDFLVGFNGQGHEGVTSTGRSRQDSCLFIGERTSFLNEGWATRDTFTYCTFVSSDKPAFQIPGCKGDVLIDHCTFVSFANFTGLESYQRGVFTMSDEGGLANCDSVVFTNNIVASMYPGNSGLDYCTSKNFGTLLNINPRFVRNKFFPNWNCYYVLSRLGYHGDRSIAWRDSGATAAGLCGLYASRPGIHQFHVAMYDSARPRERQSVHGYPQFDRGGSDTTFVIGFVNWGNRDSIFNVAIGSLSAAKGMGRGGTDIGAVAVPASGTPVFSIDRLSAQFQHDATNASRPDTVVATINNTGSGTLVLSSPTVSDGRLQYNFGSTSIAAGGSTTLTLIMTNPTTATGTYRLKFRTNATNVRLVTFSISENHQGSGGKGTMDP